MKPGSAGQHRTGQGRTGQHRIDRHRHRIDRTGEDRKGHEMIMITLRRHLDGEAPPHPQHALGPLMIRRVRHGPEVIHPAIDGVRVPDRGGVPVQAEGRGNLRSLDGGIVAERFVWHHGQEPS